MASGGGRSERKSVTLFWRLTKIVYWQQGLHADVIRSPAFDISLLNGIKCQLKFYPKVKGSDNICLHLCSKSQKRLLVDCEFSILSPDESVIWTRTVRNRKIQYGRDIAMPECPTYDDMFVTKKSTFLPHGSLSVRCRIWKSDSNFPMAECHTGRSLILVGKDRMDLKLIGLDESMLDVVSKKYFVVPCYYGNAYKEFGFEFSLAGQSLEHSELKIKMEYVNPTLPLMFKLKAFVLGAHQEKVRSFETNWERLSKVQTKWTLPKLVTRKELMENNSPFMIGGGLNLRFRLTTILQEIVVLIDRPRVQSTVTVTDRGSCNNVSATTETSFHITFESPVAPHHAKWRMDCLGKLSKDLYLIYQKRRFTDFTLHCGAATYSVHKNILDSRSGFFREMFSKETTGTSFMDIKDVAPNTLNRMLVYMYTGYMSKDVSLWEVYNLYVVASWYLVPSLKHRCSVILQSNISLANLSWVLTLSDWYEDEALSSVLNDFIVDRFDDIMLSDEWKTFVDVHPYLAGMAMHRLHKRKVQNRRTETSIKFLEASIHYRE